MKLAFVTPRYGPDVTAGADHACRLVAEHLSRRHDVEVLTTTARDARSWASEYSEGADRVRRVLVRRFAVSRGRDAEAFERLTRQLREGPRTRDAELAWVNACGPTSAGLTEYLRRQHRAYDALVFFGLLNPLTVHGLDIAPRQSLLFPCAQLRPALRFDLWSEMLGRPRAVGYFSTAEQRLVHRYVGFMPHYEEVVGIGVDPPRRLSYPRHQQDPDDAIAEDESGQEGEPAEDGDYLARPGVPFRRRHRLYGRLALFAGRVEPNAGCEEMLEYFDAYAAGDAETTLVLMGVKLFKVPPAPHVHLAGVLPDRERMTAYEAATVTIAPGVDDLLAEPVLESLAVGTPVLANARNQAAVDHCRQANAGLFYANREEFVEALTTLTGKPQLRRLMGDNGRRYVRQHHQWESALRRFDRLLGRVGGRAQAAARR